LSDERPHSDREDLLLGTLLVKNRLLSQPQVDECLATQQQVLGLGVRMKLGEIVLQKGLIDPETLQAMLRVQRLKLTGVRRAIQAQMQPESRPAAIGELALENGLITEEQLREVLALQKRVLALGLDKEIGEILLEKGYVDREGLQGLAVIEEKRSSAEFPAATAVAPAAEAPVDEESRLGALAVQNRVISPSQLEQALKVQAQCRKIGIQMRLGEVLVYLKLCPRKAVESLSEIQGIRGETGFRGLDQEMARALDDGAVKTFLQKQKSSAPKIGEGLKVQAALAGLGIKMSLAEVLLEKQVLSRDDLYLLSEGGRKKVAAAGPAGEAWKQWAFGAALVVLVVGMAIPILRHKQKPWEPQAGLDAPGSAGRALPRGGAPLVTGGALKPEAPASATVEPAADGAPTETPTATVEDPLLARARTMLPRNRQALLEVAALPADVDGRAAFQILGWAALPDGTAIPTCLLFAGRPVPGTQRVLEVRGGYFASMIGPLPADAVVLQGLYTGEAEFVLSLLLERGGTLPKGQHLPQRLVRRFSFAYGTEEGEQAEAQQVAAMFRSFAKELAEAEGEALRQARTAKGKPSDEAVRTWGQAYGEWTLRMDALEQRLADHESLVIAPRFPGLGDAVAACLASARGLLRALTIEVYGACGKPTPFEDASGSEFIPSVEVLGRLDQALAALATRVGEAEAYRAGSLVAAAGQGWTAEARALAAEATETLARAKSGDAFGKGTALDADAMLAWAWDWDARAEGLEERDPGLSAQLPEGFAAEFTTAMARLRQGAASEARAILTSRRAQVPPPFSTAQGPALGEVASGLQKSWEALDARLRK